MYATCVSNMQHWNNIIKPITYIHGFLLYYVLLWCIMSLSWTYTWWRHDDVIKRKHFPRYWPFMRGIHRSPVNSPHKGQWRGALTFPLIYAWINSWVNNSEDGDLRRHHAHYDVTVMQDVIVRVSQVTRLLHQHCSNRMIVAVPLK